jgi:type IV pilus assembly protein PilQ
MSKQTFYFLLTAFLFTTFALAQQDANDLGRKLDELAVQKKGLNEVLKIDISGLSLHDFIASVAEEHQLNIDVDADLTQPVVNNFFDVTVKDVFIYLAQKYDLEVGFMNNIISFKKRKEVKIIEKKIPKVINVDYNPQNDFLSVRLENDSLAQVAKAIIDKSGKNLVLAPDIKSLRVTSYILNRPFDQVIEMTAKSNDLIATKDENGFYYLEKNSSTTAASSTNTTKKASRPTNDSAGFFSFAASRRHYV